ncbi:GCN5 family N-acetyltransferase [Sphaerisporangium rufum]|uniref:GCN5 family N-acetyltransferase n=1 Tax=Sphaerisporangium rufum TaxID=1381558 RepID=A0A919R896_9ACTN|nr:GNAT family N-acetyltransferase [Sphaerisporangium rufum]GII81482.1 GCN5 family N-acetyltransferase [Sphaerisporangium rufum]
MRIRNGGPDDAAAVLEMFDAAVRRLVAAGRAAQWGTEPFSAVPARVAQVAGFAASGGMRIAEVAGRPAGCLVVGDAMPYVPPAGEPELYVRVLLTSGAYTGRGVGAALLRRARQEAVAGGKSLLRVDCWAGGDGRLVRYYQEQGFTPAQAFTVGDWPGRVLEMRLPGPAD